MGLPDDETADGVVRAVVIGTLGVAELRVPRMKT